MSIKTRVPWYLKVPAKMVLSRLPLSPAAWRRLGIFRLGSMDDPEGAIGIFSRHFRWFESRGAGTGFTVLEIGPGDSIAGGILTAVHGGACAYLIDSGNYATQDMRVYRNLLGTLRARGIDTLGLEDCKTFDDLCTRSGIHYRTEGTASLGSIPDGSVDFVFSNAVLEHVPRPEFEALVAETRRVLRQGGICSHGVDLRDHLGEALNNLRFSDEVWESRFMAESGFYTNRIRYREMLDIFDAAGFSVKVVGTVRWDRLPTERSKLTPRFRGLEEDDLLVSSFDVVLE